MRNKRKLLPPCEKPKKILQNFWLDLQIKFDLYWLRKKEKQTLEMIKQLKQSTVKEAA